MTTATLKATKVFSYLRPEEIDILSNYASTEQYKAGAIVYRKGQPAARAYVLLEGEVILRAPTPTGHGIVIEQVGYAVMRVTHACVPAQTGREQAKDFLAVCLGIGVGDICVCSRNASEFIPGHRARPDETCATSALRTGTVRTIRPYFAGTVRINAAKITKTKPATSTNRVWNGWAWKWLSPDLLCSTVLMTNLPRRLGSGQFADLWPTLPYFANSPLSSFITPPPCSASVKSSATPRARDN